MTDHATEAERFHNEYLRLRTPGQLPTTADVLALANYHATMAVHDAIRELAPKPVETDDARPTRCGKVRTNQLGGPYHPCHLNKGHDGAHLYIVQMLQDAAGSPQSDEQPEPGQVDGDEAAEAGEFSDCPRCDHHLRAVQHFKSRAEKAEAELESSRRGGVVLSATDYTTLVDRAGKAEAALEAARSAADHFAAERDKYRNERDAILHDLRVLRDRTDTRHALTEMLADHTPEG